MTKLALTLPLGDTEPPYSYVSRLAALNGSCFAQDFAFDMGVTWSSITNGEPNSIEKMADLASLRTEDLKRFNIVRMSDRRFRIAQENMRGKTMMRKDIKICSKCLAEDAVEHGQYAPYLRSRWTISSYRICSKHRVPLIRLDRADYPRCMYDVAQRLNDQKAHIDAHNEGDRPEFGSGFSSYLKKRIGGRLENTWLDSLNLDLVCRFCEALGVLLEFGPKIGVRKCDEADLAKATESGFKVAIGGPDKINGAMLEVRKGAASARNGLYVDFGVFYDFLNKLDHCDKQNAPLLDLAANFAFSEYSYEKGDILFGRVCPKRYNYCPSSLAARYGLAKTTARKFMRSVGGDDLTQGRPVLRAERIIPVMERFTQSILPSDAATKLGVPAEMFIRLVKAGLIPPCPHIAGTVQHFETAVIDEFKQHIFSKSTEVAHLCDEWIPLNRAGQNFGYKLDHVCKLILDGSFGTVRHCPTASSLYHLHLNKADVHKYMSATAAIGYSKAELRRILAVNDPTVALIVRNGMMSGVAAKNPHNNKKMIRFLSEEIDSFLQQYLPLGLFARNAQMQPRAAMLYFSKLDLNALEWPRKYSRIYRRNGLPSEIAGMQIGWSLPAS